MNIIKKKPKALQWVDLANLSITRSAFYDFDVYPDPESDGMYILKRKNLLRPIDPPDYCSGFHDIDSAKKEAQAYHEKRLLEWFI